MENNQNQIDKEKKKKKKVILLIILAIAFLVPVGFGIYNLIPDPVPPTRSYPVELKDNYNNGLTLSKNIAYPDYNFVTDITIDQSIILDRVMPDALSEGDVLCLDKPITYTYSVSQDKFSARLTIPKENIKGKITINVPLVTPTETFPITLKANGGKFIDGRTEMTINGFAGCKLTDLHGQGYSRPNQFREGYHFTHWELETNRDVKLYEDDIIPFAPRGVTYVANCELNEIKVTLKPGTEGAFIGKGKGEEIILDTLYDTKINEIEGYLGDPSQTGYKFLYYTDSTGNRYYSNDTVSIPGKELVLNAYYSKDLYITLDANGGEFPSGAETYFDTYSGITLIELEGYMEPTSTNKTFTYWTIGEDITRYYQNTELNLEGSITLKANYSEEECPHDVYSGYTVSDNKLYGICEHCGAQILISDEALAGDEYKNKILVTDHPTNEDEIATFTMHNISEMPSIIASAPTSAILEMYLITGNYDLDGSRPEGEEVKVNLHGLKNNEGELNATVNCGWTIPEKGFPREYHGINFVMNNLIMKGECRYGAGFYFGLFADSITYNNCAFIGKQSLYSSEVIFNNCSFTSTDFTDEPDYAIYSYNSFNVEFNQCSFLSDGKAVKIYSEGAGAGAVFKFTDCDFNIKTHRSDKAAIQVNSSEQKVDDPYKIYITRCTQVGYTGGLYADTSDRAKFIVTNE